MKSIPIIPILWQKKPHSSRFYLRNQASDPNLAKLSEQMQEYWTNFARNGDPNGAGLPIWSRYDLTTRPYMDLSNAAAVPKEDLRRIPCAIHIERLTRYMDERARP